MDLGSHHQEMLKSWGTKANGKLYMQWADQAGNAGTSRPILVNIGKRGPQGITV